MIFIFHAISLVIWFYTKIGKLNGLGYRVQGSAFKVNRTAIYFYTIGFIWLKKRNNKPLNL